MTLTRQHFQLVADVIAGLPAGTTNETFSTTQSQILAERFADALASTNDQFDRSRFLKACESSVTRISSLDRLRNSVNGNPRYKVHFTNGTSAITQSDAAFCFGIENPEMRGDVVVNYTRAGRIADIRPY